MTDTLDRLERLVARLETLGISIEPAATQGIVVSIPANVASGELIESAWGNDVVTSITEIDGILDGIDRAFAAQVSGLGAGPDARFRMHTQAVSATPDAAGAVTVTFPAATFQSPPVWVLADDFYVGIPPGDPAAWNTFKVDGSVQSATSTRVLIARAGLPVTIPVGFRITAFGRWA